MLTILDHCSHRQIFSLKLFKGDFKRNLSRTRVFVQLNACEMHWKYCCAHYFLLRPTCLLSKLYNLSMPRNCVKPIIESPHNLFLKGPSPNTSLQVAYGPLVSRDLKGCWIRYWTLHKGRLKDRHDLRTIRNCQVLNITYVDDTKTFIRIFLATWLYLHKNFSKKQPPTEFLMSSDTRCPVLNIMTQTKQARLSVNNTSTLWVNKSNTTIHAICMQCR